MVAAHSTLEALNRLTPGLCRRVYAGLGHLLRRARPQRRCPDAPGGPACGTAARPAARLLALWLLASSAAGALAATPIEVSVSPESVHLDEPFRISFQASGGVDGEPDFTPLEQDFEILGRSRSQNLSFAQGRLQRSTVWVLSVRARRSGDLSIPAIDFGSDRSEALGLQVLEAAPPVAGDGEPKLILEVEALPERVYVQQQIILKVRLLRRMELDLGDASLSEPDTGGMDVLVEKLGKDRSYYEQRGETRWRVVDRRFALFPQESGTLDIAPIVFEGQVVEGTSSYGNPFGNRIVTRRMRSDPLRVQVEPVPASVPAEPWLPARNLRLQQVWSDEPARLQVGQPITRTLAVIAEGLTAAQLPELAPALPEGIKQYPEMPELRDQSSGDGVSAIRQEKIVLIASEPGRYTLPAVELAWWNVERGGLETARLPEQTVEVRPAPGQAAAPAAAPPAAQPAAPTPVEQQTAVGPEDTSPAGQTEASRGWALLAALLALGWVATAAAWWWRDRGRRPAQDGRGPAAAPAPRFRQSALREVLLANRAEAARDALLAWGQSEWPERPPAALGELARRCGGELGAAIQVLNRALYRPEAAPWEAGQSLWNAFQAWPGHAAARAADTRGSALEPMVPGSR